MKKLNELNTNTPTIIIILGVTGDLSHRKLFPAIFDLYTKDLLPDDFAVVGFARRDIGESGIRKIAESSLSGKPNKKNIKEFLEKLYYQKGFFDEANSYKELGELLKQIDEKWGLCSNKLFYLATPPNFYEAIFKSLDASGLNLHCNKETGWTRVLVEKPFGKDIKTATELDRTLGKLFNENQIFRIDHYLAKETVQNILMFRFSNSIFEPLWNNQYIEKVEIKIWETLGVEKRGSFYHDTGALRDVGQNHILQMLALVAMDNPKSIEPKNIRRNRASVFQSLFPIKKEGIEKSVVRGQYEGFTQESGVEHNSQTETYFKIQAYLNNSKWDGVPFYLESGKKMKEAKTEIKIHFKKVADCLCPKEEENHKNILTLRIQPNEGITIKFWVKKPGFSFDLSEQKLTFMYPKDNNVLVPDAYERVIIDCIKGDQTLFTSTEEVKAAWEFITPIIENWNKAKLYIYKTGSDGRFS